jgi:hypothetical protein
MNSKFNRYVVTILFGLALLAGCSGRDVEVRTEGDSPSARDGSQVNTEAKSESTRSKSLGHPEPPNITGSRPVVAARVLRPAPR